VICYKNTFFQALTRLKSRYSDLPTFFPTTYQLPFQFGDFQREHIRLCGELARVHPHARPMVTWIIKPRRGCCGNGIRLVQSAADAAAQADPAVIQRYVAPYLLDGLKFDFRLYVLVASLAPLTIYLYNEGLARFCTHAYADPTRDTLDDRFCHLTNTAVNVANAQCPRPILELSSNVISGIARVDPRGAHLWNRIRQAVLLSVAAQYEGMIQSVGLAAAEGKQGSPKKSWKTQQRPLNDLQRYFHILGIDIIVDEHCEPVVLELNDRPSMCVTYAIEEVLKSRVVYDALNIVTVDGLDGAERIQPGGWEKLLPGSVDPKISKAVAQILERSYQGQKLSARKMIAKRLGYIPSGSYLKQICPLAGCILPPLHDSGRPSQ
jgi:hypothetical protein